MSPAMKNPAKDFAEELVAEPPAAPYTGPVGSDRNGAHGPWWREGVRSWIPMLAIGVTLVLSIQSQVLGIQRQVGDLRVEVRDVLRAELRKELTPIRSDMEDVKRRLTRIEAEVVELRSDMDDVQHRLTRVEDRVIRIEDRVTRIESLVERNSQPPAESGLPGEVGAGHAASAD